MKIYPAIDLREGATVQLVGGDPSREAVHEPDALKVAQRWVDEGASLLHMVDLDAAIGTGSNLHVVERILRNVPLPVQLGGGIRHLVDIQKRLDLGVGRVIVGTQGIRHPDWFETAADVYPHRLLLAVDARGDDVTVAGWKEASGVTIQSVLKRVQDLPLAGLLYTNVDIEGRMCGIDRAAVEDVVRHTEHPVVASGGIATLEDLDVLKDLGAAGAVLGMSIYTGRIRLKDAIERIEERIVETGRHVLIPTPDVQWGAVPEGATEGHSLRASDADDARERRRSLYGTGWGRRRRGEADEDAEAEGFEDDLPDDDAEDGYDAQEDDEEVEP